VYTTRGKEERTEGQTSFGGARRTTDSNGRLSLDLHEQFEVQMEEGLDAFVVVDGLPIVTEDNKPKLVKFLTKRLNEVGRAKADQIFMPIDEATGKSQGYVWSCLFFSFMQLY
jgi:hypothetical protein